MKKQVRILLVGLAGIFVIIQFIPSGRPENNPVQGKDIASQMEVGSEVHSILKNACFDCHSQNTRFPWYSYVAPVSWLISRDVNQAREHLDFSNWGDLSLRDRIKIFDHISEEVSEEEMPLKIYILMHPPANLSSDDRDIIVRWAENAAEKLMQ